MTKDNKDDIAVLFSNYRKGTRREQSEIISKIYKMYSGHILYHASTVPEWDKDQIIQNAHIRIYKALERYDPNNTTHPATYLFLWLKGCLRDYVRTNCMFPIDKVETISTEFVELYCFSAIDEHTKIDLPKILSEDELLVTTEIIINMEPIVYVHEKYHLSIQRIRRYLNDAMVKIQEYMKNGH